MESKKTFQMNAYKASLICMLLSFVCLFLPWFTFTTSLRGDGEAQPYQSFDELEADDSVLLSYLGLVYASPQTDLTLPASEEIAWQVKVRELPFDHTEYLAFYRKQIPTVRRGWLSQMAIPSFVRNQEKLKTLWDAQYIGDHNHAAFDPEDPTENTYDRAVRYSRELRTYTKRLYLLIGCFVLSLLLFCYRIRLASLPYAAYASWFLISMHTDENMWISFFHYGDSLISWGTERETLMRYAFLILFLLAAVLQLPYIAKGAPKREGDSAENKEAQKWKRFLPLMSAAVCMIVLLVVYLSSARMKDYVRVVEQDGIMYVIHGEEASVSGLELTEDMEELVIPDTIEGVPVVSVLSLQPGREKNSYDGHDHFHDHVGSWRSQEPVTVKRLVFPDSVRTLWSHGLCSFGSSEEDQFITAEEVVLGKGLVLIHTKCKDKNRIFSSTSSVEIPASVTYLKEQAFYGARMREVHFAGELAPRQMEDDCFGDCPNLEIVELPEGITEIESYTFADCPALKEVRGAKELEAIWFSAFRNCTSLKRLDGFDKNKTQYDESSFEGTSFPE